MKRWMKRGFSTFWIALLFVALVAGCSHKVTPKSEPTPPAHTMQPEQTAQVEVSAQPTQTAEPQQKQEIAEVMAFTLEACSSCTESLDALEQLKKVEPGLKYTSYSITEDTDMVNKYAITVHPTLLFLNRAGEELGRLEKETEWSAFEAKLQELRSKTLVPITEYNNQQVDLRSTNTSLYFFNEKDGKYIEVTQFIENKTQVKFPKISALNKLLAMRDLPDTLYNPAVEFHVTLQNVSGGRDGETIITLSDEYTAIADSLEGEMIRNMIALTLIPYGVEKVQVTSKHFESPILTPAIMDAFRSPDQTHVYHGEEGSWTPKVGVYEYNMNLLFQSDIEKLLCYCGCDEIGHTSNHNCFFTYENGKRVIDQHGENCKMCMDITWTYMKMKGEGKSFEEIKQYVTDTFGSK